MLAWTAIGLIAIGLAAGITLWPRNSDHAPAGITTTLGDGPAFGGTAFYASDDQVTDQQWRDRSDTFKALAAAGPIVLDHVETGQARTFVGQAVTDPEKATQLKAAIDSDAVEMVAIGLFDDCSEDGDVVSVAAGDINVVVPLTHRVQYVLVPVPKGATGQVSITGVKDGTGGITLGMVAPSGVVHMPRLEPGATTSMSVR